MKKELYVQLFSLHGLLRSENLEMGKDADTGGQILYVTELAKEFSKSEHVRKIDVFTRLLSDKSISPDYSEPLEMINDKLRIVRIQCGGRKYIRKELLWPSLEEYIDRTISFIKKEGDLPDIVHGHYADAGYIAMSLSKYFGTPFVFTGHSLGRSKFDRLLKEGMKEEDILKKFKIDHRINVEEEILKSADLVIASTSHEINQQYGIYKNNSGPEFSVIPPGFDLQKFYPFYHEKTGGGSQSEKEKFALMNVKNEMNRFFINSDKPPILTICRPEKRKNINGLIESFGKDKELQAIANLAIFAGLRKDISQMEENEKSVLTEMLLLMDKYDLYGKMAIPKTNDFEYEVPALYRHAAEMNGVFSNIALIEPFGLTLIEASASGVPIVATSHGGPNDILQNLKNGLIVDPKKPEQVSHAIKKIITDKELWNQFSRNGVLNVKKYYTWESHCSRYFEELKKILRKDRKKAGPSSLKNFIGKRMNILNYLLVTDIDNTLIGNDNTNLPALREIIRSNRSWLGFGVATGRTIESATEYLNSFGIEPPDIYITSVGTEIFYKSISFNEKGWSTHISRKWYPDRIKELLSQFSFLEYQEGNTQRSFKISYYMRPNTDHLAQIHHILKKSNMYYTLIYSHDKFLDIVPHRASKGKAIKYLSQKWNIPSANILVCGDSGNDEAMLRGGVKGVVVSNYSSELEKLKGLKNIYFSEGESATGIINGLNHFNFLNKGKKKGE